MFITSSRRGYQGTSQYGSGDFLILFTNPNAPRTADGKLEIRAIVRKVALRQCGHFMMGGVRLLGVRFVLSGQYGSDGLPCDVTTYAQHGAAPHPGEFPDHAACEAYYAAKALIPWSHREKAPGLWDRLHVVPSALASDFWRSGNETQIRAWATTNAPVLRHLREA